MFKIPFLRNILLISLLLVIVVPLYDLTYIYPAYRNLLTEKTEQEAVRFVNYLVRTLDLAGAALTSSSLPTEISNEADLVMQDSRVVKLRIFSPQGEIIFSTQAEEVGKVNEKHYFHQIVARGKLYSKLIKKDRPTAEGVLLSRDVVETYVPVMSPNGFGGAMEVYYDVTESRREIEQLNRNSSTVLIALCVGMLSLVLLTLRKAQLFFEGHLKAEQALQEAKDGLEVKVRERTEQLELKNQQLKDEISEKTLTQMALKSALSDSQEARERIDGILQSVTDGLLVVDMEQRIVLANPSVRQLFQIGDREIIGAALDEISGRREVIERVRTAMAERDQAGEFDLQVDDRVYLGRFSSVVNDEQVETAIILLLQDVTQARELDQLKSDFLAMAAHELHTPITTIMGYSELLQKADVFEFGERQVKEFLITIHQKAEALSNIVDDLLDISRMEAGQVLSLTCEPFNLKEELEQLLEICRHEHPEYSFVTDEVSGDLVLTADRQRFRQLVQNLVGNAVKYSSTGGQIAVGAERTTEGIRLQVSDNGIGMSAEQAAQAFERFYRGDTSNTAVSGTGLGLSIVRNIVEAHGGRVWLESEPGNGTTVFCFFPLAAA